MNYKSVTVLGHPFSSIGRGHDARLTFKAIKSTGLDVKLFDIYQHQRPTMEQFTAYGSYLTEEPNAAIQIFTLNGDEITPCFDFLKGRLDGKSYKIVYPQWELEHYPAHWAEQLNKFDEIWAPSKFVQKSLQGVLKKEIQYLPLPIDDTRFPYRYSRRYFQLPESDFLFLLAFDFTSFLSRKNPWDVIKAFKLFLEDKKYFGVKLVLKLNNSHSNENLFAKLLQEINSVKDYVIIIDKTLSDIEAKSLIWNCNCYISLHRSEGFGRSQAEAMLMKIPVIATGYSGNAEYMNNNNSFPVKYKMIAVGEDEYPFAENQKWAQPNLEDAVMQMNAVYFRKYENTILENGYITIQQTYSIKQTGYNFLNRITAINDRIK